MARRQDANPNQNNAEPQASDTTGGLVRRLMRNKLSIVTSTPVDETPFVVLSRWAQEMGLDISHQEMVDLARSLRECIFFEEDGSLCGKTIVSSIRRQAKLIAKDSWADKNTLRFLADRVEDTLRTMGLL